jgi:hypothetical protein
MVAPGAAHASTYHQERDDDDAFTHVPRHFHLPAAAAADSGEAESMTRDFGEE